MHRYVISVEHSHVPATYDVHIQHPDGRVTNGVLDFDMSGEGFVWQAISGIESGKCSLDDIRDVGSQLWNALCPKSVRDEISAIKGNEPVVLMLDIPNDREIEGLPWEAAFSLSSNMPLCADARYSLTRATPADMPPPLDEQPRRTPLRMLVVIPEGSELPVAYEWGNLERFALSLDGMVTLEKLDGAVTADVLARKLEERWDIFHYIGHGECDATGRVTIRLNRVGSDSQRLVDALTFAQLISSAGIRLAVLNCCKGASPSTNRTLSGLGAHLARTAGIPAVVAMRYETLEPAAIRFSDSFYRTLLSDAHFGRVDIAVQAARRSLSFNTEECGSRSYINPIVYVRNGFECLFDRAAPVKLLKVAQKRTTIPLPDDLRDALAEQRCVLVVGPGICASDAVRRKSQISTPLQTLLCVIAKACQYPDDSEIKMSETAGDGYCTSLLARVCEHYQNREQRYGLIRFLRQHCSRELIPDVFRTLASLNVAGYLYTHFDGLLEEALGRSGITPRTVNAFSKTPSPVRVRPTIVNLRGSLSDPDSVVLTETDHEERFDALKLPVAEIAELLGEEIGRTVVLLGASPRDPLVRRALSQHLDTSPKRTQGERYIVSPVRHPVDEAYWHRFDVHWIARHPEAVIEALLEAQVR
jgi:hypothetical protein